MSVETCQECCCVSTAGEAESSRAGGSVLSSILQSKLLVPPPGSFPEGQGGGARGRGDGKEEIDKKS